MSYKMELNETTYSIRRCDNTNALYSNNVLSSWFNHGRKENGGEDSDPFIIVSKNNNWGAIGVFDGMGGSGSAIRTMSDGEKHTDAYIASRLVRDTTLNYVINNKKCGVDFDTKALSYAIKHDLDVKKEELNIVPSKLKSTMMKILPTTMAMMSWDIRKTGIEIYSYWAGDSRNYILFRGGLCQVSKDHARNGGDAMYNLHNDPPMSNCISQSEPFYISKLSFVSNEPIILISCTDGCFGYLPSPMHFEKLLLDTLYISNNEKEWANNIDDALLCVSGDDYSIAITMIGLSFNEWKKHMRSRYKYLIDKFIKPYDICDANINFISTKMYAIWNSYKIGYEELLNTD